MSRPRITIHSAMSLDGRLNGFGPDLALFYERATALPQQAVLTGSATIAAAAAQAGVDLSARDEAPPVVPNIDPGDKRPVLAIVDSSGRITRFAWLRAQPHWREVLVLGSAATPPDHLQLLRDQQVESIVAGDPKVDLELALKQLRQQRGVEDVRVDAGPTLNGELVRRGLVDAVSVLIAPYLIGSGGDVPLWLLDALAPDQARSLRLEHVERLRADHVWLRYTIAK